MDQNCRLCLKQCTGNGKCTTLMNEEFRRKLSDVFTFPVEIESHLPVLVCGKCTFQVTDFHAYSCKVRANQDQILQSSEGSVFKELFEVVKVEPTEKGQLFEVEPGIDLANPVNESLEATENQFKERGEPAANHCSDQPEIEPVSVVQDPIRKPRRRQGVKLTKNLGKLSLADNERNQRRNGENQRINNFFKMDCEICPTKLVSFSNLQLHYRKMHNSSGFIRCCDKVLTRRAQLIEHMCVHEGALRCDVCQKSYKCSRSFNLHKLNSHSKDEQRPFKCDKCHQSYPKQHLLTAHLVRHVQERCAICEKVLSSSQALKVHIAQVHGGDSNQICATCGKEFRTKRAMDRHIKEHLGLQVVDKVQCYFCEKWFNGKYNLKKHIRYIHIEEGQDFQCDICKQKYPNTRALVYHKQRVHVEEKFECEYCGKRFKRKIYLKEHIASHTGQPLYSCDMCDATFNSNGNLYAHRRSKHTAELRASRQSSSIGQLTQAESEPII